VAGPKRGAGACTVVIKKNERETRPYDNEAGKPDLTKENGDNSSSLDRSRETFKNTIVLGGWDCVDLCE